VKVALRILLAVVVLVGFVAILGLSVPRDHFATSRIRLRQSPDTVWAVMRDFARTAEWWPDVSAVRQLPDLGGRERWEESTRMGTVGLIVADERPPHFLKTTIDTTGGSSFGGDWLHAIAPTGNGTMVTITERGWVSNPLFRSIGNVTGYFGTIDSYLTALGRHFGETVTPEHVTNDR
jgi:uncharacterized protein YndB with AHSA1/START domain